MVKFGDLVQLVDPLMLFVIYANRDDEHYIMLYAHEVVGSYLEDYIVTFLDESPYGLEVCLMETINY